MKEREEGKEGGRKEGRKQARKKEWGTCGSHL
jgi:hypothetical protein